MDLIIRIARLSDRSAGELTDIGIEGGRFVALELDLAAEARSTTPGAGSPVRS